MNRTHGNLHYHSLPSVTVRLNTVALLSPIAKPVFNPVELYGPATVIIHDGRCENRRLTDSERNAE